MKKLILLIQVAVLFLALTDVCSQWYPQNSGTTNPLLEVFFTDANTGTAVGDEGTILKTTTGGVTFVNQISSEIPEKYSLYQNYPNPFNPTTNIRFALPRSSFVLLIVYDVLGKEVSVLVNEELKAGAYNYDWSGVDLPGGVYFYKLETEEFTNVKKMVLLK